MKEQRKNILSGGNEEKSREPGLRIYFTEAKKYFFEKLHDLFFCR